MSRFDAITETMTTMATMLTGENQWLHSPAPDRVGMGMYATIGESVGQKRKGLIVMKLTRLGASVRENG